MGQGISTTQFFLYGKRHFTKTGYLKHVNSYQSPFQTSAAIQRNQEGADGVDLNGRVIVITGANSGLGKELATYAAAKGAKTYMLCRSEERAKVARDDILAATSCPKDQVEILLADLSEMSQVRRVVAELQGKESKVDVLVCNGGALADVRKESSDGVEVTFASHLLGGSFLLSQLLIPQLKVAAASSKGEEDSQPKVVFVSSGGMYNTKFPTDWETASCGKESKQTFDGQFAYAYAKRGQVLLAEYNTKAIPEITWVSAHPGWTSTPGVDAAYGESQKYLQPLRSPWEGAEGIAWMFGAKGKEVKSGEFYLDRRPQRKHLAGPFFSEGSYTKNTVEDVEEMVKNLKKAAKL